MSYIDEQVLQVDPVGKRIKVYYRQWHDLLNEKWLT